MTIKNSILGLFYSTPDFPEMPVVKFESDSDKIQALKNYQEAINSVSQAKICIRTQELTALKNRYSIQIERFEEWEERIIEIVKLNSDDKKFQKQLIYLNPEIAVNFTDDRELLEYALKVKPSIMKLLPDNIREQDSIGEFFVNNLIKHIVLLPEKFRDSPSFIHKAYLKAKEHKNGEWESGSATSEVKKAVGPKLKMLVSNSNDFESLMANLAEKEVLGKNIFNGVAKSAFSKNSPSWTDTFIKR